jgi:hypothetical protein
VRSAGPVGAGGAFGLTASATVGALIGDAMAAVGAAGDRPYSSAGLAGVAFGVQLHHHLGAEGGVVLGVADPLGQSPPDRARTGISLWLRATNTGSRLGVAGRPVRWRAASIARWRMASGLRAGMPSPCRVNALRSDGQVVPSSAAAALTLPSCSASRNARSASARFERNWLGCQPRGGRGYVIAVSSWVQACWQRRQASAHTRQ